MPEVLPYMEKIKGIIFDLDGTLLYTLEDIANAENKALAEMDLPPLPIEEFRWVVGGGADDIAKRLLPAELQSEHNVKQFVERFRSFYHQNWHDKTRLYDGISDLLDALIKKNIKLAILSNKPEEFALKIVDFYFPDWQGTVEETLFTHVMGQRKDYPVKPDPTLALKIAQDWNLEPAQIGFIGDSDIDIYTAQNAGMISIGAEWGFRGKAELESSGAQFLIGHPLDLLNYIE